MLLRAGDSLHACVRRARVHDAAGGVGVRLFPENAAAEGVRGWGPRVARVRLVLVLRDEEPREKYLME